VDIAFIGLGSNLSDPCRQLQSALRALDALAGTRLLRHSSLYRSAPWGEREQPDFVNAVAMLETTLTPRELLDALLGIERLAGRVRDGTRWGPRVLDLDILLYGDRVLNESGLHVPHPHLAERAFVLLPLAEVAPDLQVPGVGQVATLLRRVDVAGCVVLEPDPMLVE